MIRSSTKRAASPKPASSTMVARNILLVVVSVGASPQAGSLQNSIEKVAEHNELPASLSQPSRESVFRFHAERWRRETMFVSSTTAMAMHPGYQSIIGMGPEALPWILRDLEESAGHWYWALKAISGVDPVKPADRGVIPRMRAAWLEWGRAKGLIT